MLDTRATLSTQAALDAAGSPRDLGSGDAPVRANPCVLVVDDDDTIRDVVVRYLEHDGYEVLEAADGETARDLIASAAPDLVVLDLMLPVLDGIELCRWVRDASAERDLPIIMLTARAEEADRIVGLEIGADDYVVKPFSPRELVQRVRAVLRRSVPVIAPAPVRLAYGGLRLDAASREVTRDGTLLALTATEFDLLWCLASHPRVVFSREQLLAQVWRYEAGTDVGTSTVTVHVRRLREKLEADPAAPRWIATVWGVGYRFEPGADAAAR